MRNKLKPIQELRVRKAQLEKECIDHESRIVDATSYIKKHSGSLIFGYIFSPSPKKPQPLLEGIVETATTNPNISKAIQWVQKYSPIIWNMAQPMLVGYVLKRGKRMIFGKKRK